MGLAFKRISFCASTALSCLLNAGAADTNNASGKSRALLEPDFQHFVTEKRELTKRLSEKHQDAVPQMVQDFFDAAQRGDWETMSMLFRRIEAGSARQTRNPWMPISLWGPVHEVFGAADQFRTWNPQLLHRFGNEIIQKIPAGSIYFGGTDAGRFVISALTASHTEGRPFFTITQNALADGSYVEYLRDIYGAKIHLPAAHELQRAFQEYLDDAQRRMEKHQLRENESVKVIDGRVQVSGIVAVMEINERLIKFIIEKNPSREIYLEESYPLESLYAQSLPHGLIFKVSHEKMTQLPWRTVEADHKFWAEECKSLIGSFVKEETSVQEICSWTEKVFLEPAAHVFNGNRAYVQDAQAPQYWSQCRNAIAGYYEWWSRNSEKAQRESLVKEADYAYRQSVGLSPYNPTVVWRYVNFLFQNQRTNDAKVLIQMTLKLNPEKRMDIDSDQLKDALKKLRAQATK
jgi:hypothetical protein